MSPLAYARGSSALLPVYSVKLALSMEDTEAKNLVTAPPDTPAPSLATQDAILPPSLSRWTASVLGRVAQQMRERFERRVAHLGLRSKHYSVLIVLQDGPLTQTEISRSVAVDRTSMVGLIDELDRLGLVERARHPQDRRAHAVTLTAAGREALRLTTAAVDATEAECFAALSADEQRQLRALLLKIL